MAVVPIGTYFSTLKYFTKGESVPNLLVFAFGPGQ